MWEISCSQKVEVRTPHHVLWRSFKAKLFFNNIWSSTADEHIFFEDGGDGKQIHSTVVCVYCTVVACWLYWFPVYVHIKCKCLYSLTFCLESLYSSHEWLKNWFLSPLVWLVEAITFYCRQFPWPYTWTLTFELVLCSPVGACCHFIIPSGSNLCFQSAFMFKCLCFFYMWYKRRERVLSPPFCADRILLFPSIFFCFLTSLENKGRSDNGQLMITTKCDCWASHPKTDTIKKSVQYLGTLMEKQDRPIWVTRFGPFSLCFVTLCCKSIWWAIGPIMMLKARGEDWFLSTKDNNGHPQEK